MAYSKINTFFGTSLSKSALDADVTALRNAVNAVATGDIDSAAISARHFADPKWQVFNRVADGPLVTIGWERRAYGEHMFSVSKQAGQCWSGELTKVRKRTDFFLRSLALPRTIVLGGVSYTTGLQPIIGKRIRLGDRGNFLLKIFASLSHALIQNYSAPNTIVHSYPNVPAGYFVLCHKAAGSSSWTQIAGTKRHVWPSDDDFASYRAVCDYNVTTTVDASWGAGDYDVAICYIKDATAELEQLVIGPASIMLTSYNKA